MISRDVWVRYKDVLGHLGKCTQIRLESAGQGPNKWCWGFRNSKPIDKLNEDERRRREDLSIALQHHGLATAHDSRWWFTSPGNGGSLGRNTHRVGITEVGLRAELIDVP